MSQVQSALSARIAAPLLHFSFYMLPLRSHTDGVFSFKLSHSVFFMHFFHVRGHTVAWKNKANNCCLEYRAVRSAQSSRQFEFHERKGKQSTIELWESHGDDRGARKRVGKRETRVL